MSMGKIMVASGDKNICELLRLYMEKDGYTVALAYDGEEALSRFASEGPDLIILDVMMPKVDGWQVCREIRKKSEVPIIMLTAKGETFDKVLGLELGADDYVVKPFDTKEIVARIKAVLRRSAACGSPAAGVKEVSYDKLAVNMTRYELKVDGKVVDTPPKELELLFHLASNPNRVYTRDQLLDEVWGFEYYGDSRTVDVHIKRLREKLEGVVRHPPAGAGRPEYARPHQPGVDGELCGLRGGGRAPGGFQAAGHPGRPGYHRHGHAGLRRRREYQTHCH